MEPRVIERADHPISRRDIDPNVLKVLYRLGAAGHTAYLVGGGVRDLLLGRRPKDFDVATSAHPGEVRELFRNSRLIGRRFRLIHVFFGSQNVEVATFRRDSDERADADDPLIRHDNTFGTPEQDAFRRDFTINALFYDPRSFCVIDFVGAIDDLRARQIRAIGDPELRIREDPIRMIRAVRFAAKLGLEIESATRAAIERHRADLLKASVPRLVEETYRTLSHEHPDRALILLDELGLLEIVFPQLVADLHADSSAPDHGAIIENLAALGRTFDPALASSHEVILTALFADWYRIRRSASPLPGLLADLRARGFARGDTERMRLLLECLANLFVPSARTRRLMRRPYFAIARRLYELFAPTYDSDPAQLDQFLAAPDSHPHRAARRRRRSRRRRSPASQVRA